MGKTFTLSPLKATLGPIEGFEETFDRAERRAGAGGRKLT